MCILMYMRDSRNPVSTQLLAQIVSVIVLVDVKLFVLHHKVDSVIVWLISHSLSISLLSSHQLSVATV